MAKTATRSGVAPAEKSDDRLLAGLLAATADGDRKAFADLYHSTSAKLMRVAFRIVGDRELAEEILQESYLAVWQKAGRYSPNLGAPLAWLTTLVRHRAIDRLRLKGGTREFAIGAEAELEPLLSPVSGKAESAIVIQQSILRCLNALKERQRRLIVLAYYHGLTHEELAARTQAPLGTVKSDMRRGLADLKVCLEK